MIDRPDPAWLATLAPASIVAYPEQRRFGPTTVLPATVERLTKARLFLRVRGYHQLTQVDRLSGRVIGTYMGYIGQWTEGAQSDYEARKDRERLAVLLAKFNYRDAPIATVRALLATLTETPK